MSSKRSPHLSPRTIKPEDIPAVQKTPTQSVLFALPILMLLVGLYVYYKNERIEARATPIEAEAVQLRGSFNRMSSVGDEEVPEFIVELTVDGMNWNVHAGAQHVDSFEELVEGDVVMLRVAPKISGSKSLWVLSVEN